MIVVTPSSFAVGCHCRHCHYHHLPLYLVSTAIHQLSRRLLPYLLASPMVLCFVSCCCTAARRIPTIHLSLPSSRFSLIYLCYSSQQRRLYEGVIHPQPNLLHIYCVSSRNRVRLHEHLVTLTRTLNNTSTSPLQSITFVCSCINCLRIWYIRAPITIGFSSASVLYR